MPRPSGRIDEKERQIAERVRQVRYSNQLSQPEFARALDISLDRLASIEYARTPLTVGVADLISAQFDVSLIWLAHNRGRMKPAVGLIAGSCPEIKASEPLSGVVSDAVAEKLFAGQQYGWFQMAATLTGDVSLPVGQLPESLIDNIHNHFDHLNQSLPDDGRAKLLALVVRTLSKFSADWELGNHSTPGENISTNPKTPRLVAPKAPPASKVSKEMLDIQRGPSDSSGVKTKIRSLPELLKALRERTKLRGQKAALARHCEVSRQAVDQWFSGSAKPSAEATFRAIDWVQSPERQK